MDASCPAVQPVYATRGGKPLETGCVDDEAAVAVGAAAADVVTVGAGEAADAAGERAALPARTRFAFVMLTASMPAMKRPTASSVKSGPCFFTGPQPPTKLVPSKHIARPSGTGGPVFARERGTGGRPAEKRQTQVGTLCFNRV